MKKSFILITLIAVLISSVALACAADNPDCSYTGSTVWGIVSSYYEYSVCPIHVNCTISEHWGYYGWLCPSCHYGQESGQPAVLLSTSHDAPLR